MTTAACARPPAGFQQPQHLCSRGGSASSDAPAGATYCWPSTSPQHPKKLGRWETEPDPLPDSQTSAVPRCRRTQPREPGLQPPRAPPAPQPHPAVPRCHPAAGPQQPREPSESCWVFGQLSPASFCRAVPWLAFPVHIWTPRGSFRGAVLPCSPSEQDQALGQLRWVVGALGLEPGSLRGVGTAPGTFTEQIWLLEHRAARHKALHRCQGSWHHPLVLQNNGFRS